jgi:hypothetical protein
MFDVTSCLGESEDGEVVRWTIVVAAAVLHVSTTVVVFGSSSGDHQVTVNEAWTAIDRCR